MDPNLQAAIERQTAAHERMCAAADTLEERITTALPEGEEERAAALQAREDARTAHTAASDEFDAVTRDVEDLEHVARNRARMPREGAARAAAGGGRADIRVGDEPLTYRKGGEHSFLRDALTAHLRGGTAPAAVLERVQRHQVEHEAILAAASERAASTTSNFAGLTVPQYLTDMVAPLARAKRPVADICTHHDLPAEGMEVDISRITTGTTVAAQAAQGDAFSSTAIDDTLLSVPVCTIGGYNDLSIQAVMRSTNAEDVTVSDLMRAYAAELDRQVNVGAGSGGEMLGIFATSGIGAVTYADASPTVGEAWPKIMDAEQRVQAGVFEPATHIILAPRRLGWFKAGVDSNGRPLVTPIGGGIQGFNAMGAGSGPTGYGNTGYELNNLPVVSDGNLPLTLGAGTEDAIAVVDAYELHLWEDPNMPLLMRFEQPVGHQGQVRIVVFGFAAFTAGRYPKAVSAITGSGLIAPTF